MDYKLNIDAQDAQDNQDGRLLQEKRTRAMIACGFEDVREHKPAVSGKNPVHPVHRCEIKNLPMLDYEPVSSHQAQAFVSGKRGLTQRSLYPEGSPKKHFKMLKTNTFPGDTQRQGENFGLERCWGADYTRRSQGRLSWNPGLAAGDDLSKILSSCRVVVSGRAAKPRMAEAPSGLRSRWPRQMSPPGHNQGDSPLPVRLSLPWVNHSRSNLAKVIFS